MVKSSLRRIVGKNLYGVAEDSDSIARQSADKRWILENLSETIALGESLREKAPHLKILLLEGPLGSGKTSLVKGIARSFGISEPITSPTFALAQHYLSDMIALVHLDLYRLEDSKIADELFLQEEEEADALKALMVIEWPERLGIAIPEAWKIKLQHLPQKGRLAELIIPEN